MRQKGLVPFDKATRLHSLLLRKHQPDLAKYIYDELHSEGQR